MNLFQEFERIAKQSPNKTAIVTENIRLSYVELEDRVEDLSRMLKEAHLRPKDSVGLLLPNGCEFVIAVLAAWRLGAIVVPLHVKLQEQELSRYITACGVKVLTADHRLASVAQAIQNKYERLNAVLINSPEKILWRSAGRTPQSPSRKDRIIDAGPDPAALIQYSTGSTGSSKRVTRTHQQLFMEFQSVAKAVGIRGEERILGASPYFHSYGFINALICGILSGATLFPVDDFFTRDVVELIEHEKITGFPGVPFMFQLIAEIDGPADLSSLRYALSAGAPLPQKTARSFFDRFGPGLNQLYGTTETGVISIDREKGLDASASVGIPISGVTVEIADDEGQKLPPGINGNIAIRSAFAASSYDDLPDSNESRFANGSFFPGDLGRFDKSGRLVLSGRKRMFINVAGNKVDPAEVESVLRTHPAVVEAVVLGIPDGTGAESVKSVLVTSKKCTRVEIIDHCRGKLADFKRPSIIEFRKEIVKSPLGKILRKYL